MAQFDWAMCWGIWSIVIGQFALHLLAKKPAGKAIFQLAFSLNSGGFAAGIHGRMAMEAKERRAKAIGNWEWFPLPEIAKAILPRELFPSWPVVSLPIPMGIVLKGIGKLPRQLGKGKGFPSWKLPRQLSQASSSSSSPFAWAMGGEIDCWNCSSIESRVLTLLCVF